MGALTTILKLIGGVVVLNVIAAYNPTLAFALAATVIVAAVAVFLFTLLRKD